MKDLILKAKENISPYIKDFDLFYSDYFSKYLNSNIYFKAENLQKSGSFKIRGILNCIIENKEKCSNGIITASSGNHAQGVSCAACLLDINATIVMPVSASLMKINKVKNHNTNVILQGNTDDEALVFAMQIAKEKGLFFIHPFDDDFVIAGNGTIAIEILNSLKNVDNVILPIGGGGLASGVSSYIKEVNPNVKIIGVQSEAVSSMAASIRNRRLVRSTGASFIAEEISVKSVAKRTFEICQNNIDQIVTVSENQIAAAILEYLEKSKIVVEGAGAASLAALLSRKIDYKGKNNVVIISGGNIDTNIISRIISKGMATSGRLVEIVVTLRDIPGSLSKITQLIASSEGNILNIRHDRSGAGLPIGFTRVALEIETKSIDHVEELVIALKSENYEVTVN